VTNPHHLASLGGLRLVSTVFDGPEAMTNWMMKIRPAIEANRPNRRPLVVAIQDGLELMVNNRILASLIPFLVDRGSTSNLSVWLADDIITQPMLPYAQTLQMMGAFSLAGNSDYPFQMGGGKEGQLRKEHDLETRTRIDEVWGPAGPLNNNQFDIWTTNLLIRFTAFVAGDYETAINMEKL
jgi:hypothetical protein